MRTILLSNCIGECVLYRGRIYEVVDMTPEGYFTITNGRLSELEVELKDIIFLEEHKREVLLQSIS